MTTQIADNITQIREDRVKREKIALDGLTDYEASFEFDGNEVFCECDFMGLTLVARMDASADYEKADRECGIEGGWDIVVGYFKELYLDFGRGNNGKDIPHDSGLANAVHKAATTWLENHHEGRKPEPEGQDD